MQPRSARLRRVRRVAVALALLVAAWLATPEGGEAACVTEAGAPEVEAGFRGDGPRGVDSERFGPWADEPVLPEPESPERTISCNIDWGGPPPTLARTDLGPALVFPGSVVFRTDAPGDTTVLFTRHDGDDGVIRSRELRFGPDGCEIAGARRVRVTVVAPDLGPDEVVWVHGCGAFVEVRRDALTVDLPPQDALPPCELRADRPLGFLSAPGEPVLWTGQSALTLRAADFAPAGMGVVFSPDTLEIEELRPGSPAELVGLQPGDRFVEVDGQEVDGMDVDDFLSWSLGPEGSELSVVVERGGARVPFTIERAVIE